MSKQKNLPLLFLVPNGFFSFGILEKENLSLKEAILVYFIHQSNFRGFFNPLSFVVAYIAWETLPCTRSASSEEDGV